MLRFLTSANILPPYEWFQWCTLVWVGSISTEAVLWHVHIAVFLFCGCYSVRILTWYNVCLCACRGGVGVLWRMCAHVCLCVCVRVCVWVGEGGTALQPDILGTAGWRCWPTCSLLSSAGSSRISAAASPHKAPLCNLPKAHKYNCNQERRGGRRREDGQWRRERGKRAVTISARRATVAPVADDTVSLNKVPYSSRQPYKNTRKKKSPHGNINSMTVHSHLHRCVYAKTDGTVWGGNIIKISIFQKGFMQSIKSYFKMKKGQATHW